MSSSIFINESASLVMGNALPGLPLQYEFDFDGRFGVKDTIIQFD